MVWDDVFNASEYSEALNELNKIWHTTTITSIESIALIYNINGYWNSKITFIDDGNKKLEVIMMSSESDVCPVINLYFNKLFNFYGVQIYKSKDKYIYKDILDTLIGYVLLNRINKSVHISYYTDLSLT